MNIPDFFDEKILAKLQEEESLTSPDGWVTIVYSGEKVKKITINQDLELISKEDLELDIVKLIEKSRERISNKLASLLLSGPPEKIKKKKNNNSDDDDNADGGYDVS